jgi:hypothetical protein
MLWDAVVADMLLCVSQFQVCRQRGGLLLPDVRQGGLHCLFLTLRCHTVSNRLGTNIRSSKFVSFAGFDTAGHHDTQDIGGLSGVIFHEVTV